MRTVGFAIFLSIFLSIYGLVNYYIFVRGCQAIPRDAPLRTAYLILFPVLAASFFAGRLLERAWPSAASGLIIRIGSFWLGAMLYLFLALLALDILRLIHQFINFYPSWVAENYALTKQRLTFGICILVAATLGIGYVNALFPGVRELSVHIPKKVEGMRSLRIVMASDIHLGTIIGKNRLGRVVEMINSMDPDLVLLPGDIVDEDITAVIRENLGETLGSIRSKYGLLAVTGNHEYIGGAEKACEYLTRHGVTMLRDSVTRVNGSIYVVGREDRSLNQFEGRKRKPLGDLMQEVDSRCPVILMDHQPFRLDEAVRSKVDLQLSGHTHHGQLWPFNYVTGAIFEISCGHRQIGNTHVYVSSGVGTWGPPVRLGNRPEIVLLTLEFD